MAGGFAKDGAVQEQIDASIDDAIKRARKQLPQGEGLEQCLECDKPIPIARRNALSGVQYCISCQEELDKKATEFSVYNRRGSKDSQLR